MEGNETMLHTMYKELKDYGGGVFRNKKSGKHSVVLLNNVKDTESKKRLILFRPVIKKPSTFVMERDRFYIEFEEVDDIDKAIDILSEYFKAIDNEGE